MARQYDILVFVGRFQPFHNGHKSVIDTALTLSNQVLVLAGSSNRSRDLRNPFSFDERKEMILSSYNTEFENDPYFNKKNRITVLPLEDLLYSDDRWVERVQWIVKDFAKEKPTAKIGLIGCSKDQTSYYLKLFPTWGSERVDFIDPINATDLRRSYWHYGTNNHWLERFVKNQSFVESKVPKNVFRFLDKFADTPDYTELKNEELFLSKYKDSVKKYPRIEQTVDAVVIQSGHVLLVTRRAEPGKGKLALPGGFVNPDETFIDASLRELKEETKLKVPIPVLKGSIVTSKRYDDPNRSLRGRLITEAFLIRLEDQTTLPKVKGSDDAEKASWVPLAELDPRLMFEDHYFIIQDLIGEL